jgi:HlyD family secretion protein
MKSGYGIWRVLTIMLVAAMAVGCTSSAPAGQVSPAASAGSPPAQAPQGAGARSGAQGTPGAAARPAQTGQQPGAAARQGGAAAAGGGRVTPVEVSKATVGDITQLMAYAGNLQSKDTVKVAPLVSGRVETVLVAVGDVLKAGDPMVQLEKTVLEAQMRQADAAFKAAQAKLTRMQIGSRPEEIAAAESAARAAQVAISSSTSPTDDQRTVAAATMAKAEAALKLAQRDYDKISYSGGASGSPQALALEQATITYQSAVAAYNLTIKPTDGQLAPLQNNLAQAQLKLALTKQPYIESDLAQSQAAADQAKAALDLAKAQLDFATVRAPFDGIVAEIYVSKGTSAGASAGPVVLFVSISQEVVLDVEEARAGQVKNGQKATVMVAAYPGKQFDAAVTAIAPVADAKTHSFQVKVTPVDEGNLLKSGMYADVSIVSNQKKGTVLVPVAAVTQLNNQPVAFVVKDSVVEQRALNTGLMSDGKQEILSGVQADEMVVTAGQSGLATGSRVNVTRTQ